MPGALRADIDWRGLQLEYREKRVVVIDNLLSAAALAELQAWARHGANFRTLRRGFVGAFPADGATHPLLLTLAEELEAAAPAIFSPHTLGLWWLFKYDQTNPDGIGIHADPAAVNLNLWLTPDSAHVEGGGLEVYSRVPPLEQPVHVANTEFASREAEDELRARLERKEAAKAEKEAAKAAAKAVRLQRLEAERLERERLKAEAAVISQADSWLSVLYVSSCS